MAYIPCHDFYHSTFEYIKKHLPERLLIINHWFFWLMYGKKTGPLHNWTDCYQQFKDVNKQSYQDIIYTLNSFKNTIK